MNPNGQKKMNIKCFTCELGFYCLDKKIEQKTAEKLFSTNDDNLIEHIIVQLFISQMVLVKL